MGEELITQEVGASFPFPGAAILVGKSLPIDQTLGLPGPKNCQDNHLLNPFL